MQAPPDAYLSTWRDDVNLCVIDGQRQGFSASAPLTLGPEDSVSWGLSCALQNIQQHP